MGIFPSKDGRKFQKNKFDPVSHTFGLNLYFKKCHIFEYI
jgi:hypothetical protein